MSDATNDIRNPATQNQLAQNEGTQTIGSGTGANSGVIAPPKVQNSPQNTRFFNKIYGPLSGLASRLGLPESYILGLSAHESGYLDDHNQALNNPFGMTEAGKNNIGFSTVQDAVDKWEKSYGDQVRGAGSPEDFAGRMQGKIDGQPVDGWKRYNSVDPNWEQKVVNTIRSVGPRTQAWKNDQ